MVLAPREGTHTAREHQGNLHTALPLHLLCKRECVSLGLSALCSDSAGRTPWAPTWILGIGVQCGTFLLGRPNMWHPSNCLLRPPVAVCFLLPEQALLPASAFGKPGASLPPLARGPWVVSGALGQLTLAWNPAPSDALPKPPPHGQDCTDLGMCLQGSQSAGRHMALTWELMPWEQAWRSGV